jgi:hypothetical protein
MFYFILLIFSISTITNHCEDLRDQAIQEVYGSANKFFPILLKRSLSKLDKITFEEAEKCIEICKNYDKKHTTWNPKNPPVSELLKEQHCATTVPVLCILALVKICGWQISDIPNDLKNPLFVWGATGTAISTLMLSSLGYDKLLHQNCLYKISLIKEKLKESSLHQ